MQKALALEPKPKDGIRLQKRYDPVQDHLLRFFEDAPIPLTNNFSEQALRLSVVFRQVTHSCRSD